MAIYIGDNTKLNLRLGADSFNFIIGADSNFVQLVKMLSSDNYVLKDLNGLYLIPKEAE